MTEPITNTTTATEPSAADLVRQSRALCADVSEQLEALALANRAREARENALRADLCALRAAVQSIKAAVAAELNGGKP